MNFPLRHQRFDHSFSEGRLIFDYHEVLKNSTQAVGEVAIGTVKFGTDIGKDMLSGIYNAWNRDAESEQVKNEYLLSVSEFSRTMPTSIQKIIELRFKKGERPSLQELAQLLDHQRWIELFKDPDMFTADKTDEPVLSLGPKGIFLSLDEKGRKEMYFDYVNQLIPATVRDTTMSQYIGADTKIDPTTGKPDWVSKEEKIQTVYDNKDTVNRSMEAILGIKPIDDPNAEPEAFSLTDTALMHHYWRDGTRYDLDTGVELPFALTPTTIDAAGNKVVQGYGLKPQLIHDFDRLSRGQPLLDDLSTVEKELPPSILKGALHSNMRVITSADIPVLQHMLSERATERQSVSLDTREKVLKASDVQKLEHTRTAETLGETFSNLSGAEKAILIFLAYKAFKKMPGVVTGLGALYFGQKLLGGEKDPLNDSWKPLVQNLTGKFKNFAQPAFDSIGLKNNFKKYTNAEIQQRISIVEQYLTEVAKTDMDTSVAGFTILGDMKLSKLQSVFSISNDGSLATIRYSDTPFKKEAQKIMEDHGLNPKTSERFFGGADPKNLRNPNDLSELSGKYGVDVTHDYTSELGTNTVNKHVLDAGHALSTVFYSLAVRRPEHKVAMKQIEYFRRTYSLGTYQDLPDQEYEVDYNNDGVIDHFNPRALYVYLVRAGEGEAAGMEMTLMEFMTSQLSQSNLPRSVASKKPAAVPAGVALNPGLTPSPPLIPNPAPLLTPSPAPTPSSSPSLTPGTPVTPGTSPSITPSPAGTPSGSPSLTPSPATGPGSSPSLTPSPAATPAGSPSLTPAPASIPGSAPVLSPATPVTPGTTPTLGASPAATPSTAPVIVPNAAGNPNATTNIAPSNSSGPTSAPSAGANTTNTPNTAPKNIPNVGTGPNSAPSTQAQ